MNNEITNDDIEDMIQDIEGTTIIDPPNVGIDLFEKEKQLANIDLEDKLSLANKIVENSLSVIEKAELVFQSFSDDVIKGKDRSTSSKEMLTKSLEVMNSANTNLIQLSKALEKKDAGNTTNILVGSTISESKSGISSMNIKSHFGK